MERLIFLTKRSALVTVSALLVLETREEFAARIVSGIQSGRRLLDSHKAVVWVHPGLWLKKLGLDQDGCSEYRDAMSLASEVGVIVEVNPKHRVASRDIVLALRPRTIIGHDAHSVCLAVSMSGGLESLWSSGKGDHIQTWG